MSVETQRQEARRRAREVRSEHANRRRDKEKRLEDLAVTVLVALDTRTASERRAGQALTAMVEDEGLTLHDVIEWCGFAINLRTVTRLRALAASGAQPTADRDAEDPHTDELDTNSPDAEGLDADGPDTDEADTDGPETEDRDRGGAGSSRGDPRSHGASTQTTLPLSATSVATAVTRSRSAAAPAAPASEGLDGGPDSHVVPLSGAAEVGR